MWIYDVVASFGLPTALVIYLLWTIDRRDKKQQALDKQRDKENRQREHDLGEQLRRLEDIQRQELMDMNEASTKALAENAIALKQVSDTLNDLRNHCLYTNRGL